ncbi:MAG: hypothetical protein NTX00_02430 [Candidatus Parcubacteria bacterium]|nr:hypothetical protein [Candidatus Parcubacteria bacterium]
MKFDKGFNYKLRGKALEFTINTKIYSLKAIYQAAYLFLDKVYVFLDGDPEKEIKVIMKLKRPSFANASSSVPQSETSEDKSAGLEQIAGEFYNELLNQLLREKVSESNAKIREYIVSAALYNAVPNEVDRLLQEVEEEDWQEDPLGIAKTWEDKQNKEGLKKK